LKRSRESDPSGNPNAIVGAARRVNIERREEVQNQRERGIDQTQTLSWGYYRQIAEIKTGYNYYASVASRARLFVGFENDADTPAPIGDVGEISRTFVTAARYELSKLSRGRGGQPNLIRALCLNLLVAGECYLVEHSGTWSIRSVSELRFEADGRVRLVTSRRGGTNSQNHYLPEDATVARIWRTHPEYSEDADAALHGILADCNDLLLISRLIRASVKSSLSAGLLYVPDELRFQKSSDPAGDNTDPDTDPFEEELELSLTEPIGETDSPSEVMPLLIRGPYQYRDGIVHVQLSREFDPVLVERYKQTLERVLNGIELPSDLITSMSGVRYSNVQTISEDFLTSYIEPMLVLICEALTTVFLRPALIARGFDPELVNKVVVWYDPSAIVTRADKSDAADVGYDKMLLSGSTWRRVHGFSDADAPRPAEIVRRASLAGQPTPTMLIDMLRVLSPDLVGEIERMAQQQAASSMTSLPPAGGGTPGPDPRPDHVAAPPTPTTGPTNPPPPPEGSLPPREGEGDVLQVASERLDQQRILELLESLATTTAIGDSPIVRDRTRRLEHALEADRRLRESLSVHLNDVVKRSLERAGARTVSKIRGDSELKSLVMDVPSEHVFSYIPVDRRTTFALDEDKLVRDTIENARQGFFDLVTRAQDTGWRTLGGHVLDAGKAMQSDNVQRSWDWLVGQLVTLTRRFLNKPKSDGNYVPMEIVRDAATLAGGGSHMDAPAGAVGPRSEPKDSGRAVLSTSILEATGWELGDRYRWVYGISDNSFEPHVKLDDTIFESWQGQELAAVEPDGWPYVTHYYPGDHGGCRCDWLPEVLDPEMVNAPERGNTSGVPIAASAG